MSVPYNSNMTLSEISDHLSNISNSLYNLEKEGKLDTITVMESIELRNVIYKACNKVTWAILKTKNQRTENE